MKNTIFKKYKDFLQEAKSAPLYHGTPWLRVLSILEDGKIHPSHNGEVSASRTERYVRGNFGKESYFILDQLKISHNQKITPTDFGAGGSVKTDPRDDLIGDQELAIAGGVRRTEAEESIKGAVSLKNVDALVVQRIIWKEQIKKMTAVEKDLETRIKKDPNVLIFERGNRYKDRLNRVKKIKMLLKKYKIKLIIKSWN